MRRDIDEALHGWPYDPEPGEVVAREVRARDGRMVLQIRIELGLLQLEVEGRPDGVRPHSFATYLDYLRHRASTAASAGRASRPLDDGAEHCAEADREFAQFYHRRVAWLALQRYDRALHDADHTLGLMDFVRKHATDERLHRLARAVPRPGPVPPDPGRRAPWRWSGASPRRRSTPSTKGSSG